MPQLTRRERAALEVMRAQEGSARTSWVMRQAVGPSANLTCGALVRKGLAEYTQPGFPDGRYVITEAGRAALARKDGAA